MSQVTSGIRSILSAPGAYDAFQNLVGASRSRKRICADHIRASSGDVILDIGCGTAAILDFLPRDVHYYGFDLSQAYVDSANQRYGNRGRFQCKDITALKPEELPPCNLAIAIGLLHHLDDDDATSLMLNLHSRLAPGGRLITIDPAYWPRQSSAAHFIIARDRGQNVRKGEAYKALVPIEFSHVELIRRDDLLHIPYSHAVLECTK